MNRVSLFRRSLLAVALTGAIAGSANALTITREFSASWFDPAHSGHGFNFEVVSNGTNKVIVGFWYTYDAAGKPTWVLATGPVQGDRAVLTGQTARGGAFGNSFDPANVQTLPWGTLTVTFNSCDQGTVQYQPLDPALPAGSMPITRLTSLYNSTCTGGISGDSTASANGETVQFMDNTGLVPAASGKLRFEEMPNRSDFNAEVEDLPVGQYTLIVAGSDRGTINVIAGANGNHGELEFRSPVEPGKLLLDFDPRGTTVAVAQGGSIFLTSDFGAGAGTNPPPPPPPTGGSGAPPFGDAEYRLQVEPQGNDGPQLSARLEQRPDRVDFKVELEDVPVGSYSLSVGGEPQGTINVVTVPGGTEGQLEFREPVELGKESLDFDPRGQLIEASANGQVALSGMFPTTPSGTATGDDEGNGGGGDDGNGSSGGSGGDDGNGSGGDDGNGGSGGSGGSGGDDGNGSGGDDGNGGGDPSANVEFDINMQSTGADANATGQVSYSASSNEIEFEVEVEDLSDGNYTLRVAGVDRGSIAVSGNDGKIKFRNPDRADSLPLDFDPLGQHIEVSANGTVYLTADLPQ